MSSYTTIFLEPTAVIRRTLRGSSQLTWIVRPYAEVGVIEPYVSDVFVFRMDMA